MRTATSHNRGGEGRYAPAVRYEIETHFPRHTPPRTITVDELAELYVPDHEPVFAYGDGFDDDVLIVSLDEDFSTVSLRQDATWFWLVESADLHPVEITLCGLAAWIPAAAKLRPETGLAALRSAHDVPHLLTHFTWHEQTALDITT